MDRSLNHRERILSGVSKELPSPQILYQQRGQSGDFVLNPILLDAYSDRQLQLAAVLLGVVERDHGPQVLLTRRADHLPKHPGQIALPGGKVDDNDVSATMAALREAEEEIGLARSYVEVAGYLDTYETGTGFRVLPVVAFIQPGFELTLNSGEVAEAFEVPLAFLMNRDNHELRSDFLGGHERFFYAMPHGRHTIWGVTAGILRQLSERAF